MLSNKQTNQNVNFSTKQCEQSARKSDEHRDDYILRRRVGKPAANPLVEVNEIYSFRLQFSPISFNCEWKTKKDGRI